jgi:hypothetical protein
MKQLFPAHTFGGAREEFKSASRQQWNFGSRCRVMKKKGKREERKEKKEKRLRTWFKIQPIAFLHDHDLAAPLLRRRALLCRSRCACR